MAETFYNTEPDHAIANNDLVTIKYRLKINCFKNLEKTQALWAAATSENQNFFLQKEKNGGREIHLRATNRQLITAIHTPARQVAICVPILNIAVPTTLCGV